MLSSDDRDDQKHGWRDSADRESGKHSRRGPADLSGQWLRRGQHGCDRPPSSGASKATLYPFFASKEELFGAVVARESERYAQGFSAGVLDPRDVEGSLNAVAERFLRLLPKR